MMKNEIKFYELLERVQDVTNGDVTLLYVSRPDGRMRIVFPDRVCTSYPEGLRYLESVLDERLGRSATSG